MKPRSKGYQAKWVLRLNKNPANGKAGLVVLAYDALTDSACRLGDGCGWGNHIGGAIHWQRLPMSLTVWWQIYIVNATYLTNAPGGDGTDVHSYEIV